jgi:hypothetical protein
MAGPTNKRSIDRIRLYAPISATIEEQRITVIDVSEAGARIEHAFPLATGSEAEILFDYKGARVRVGCEVIRCKLDRSVLGGKPSYTSGLRFSTPHDPTVAVLLDMLHQVISEDLPARRKIAAKRKAETKKPPAPKR